MTALIVPLVDRFNIYDTKAKQAYLDMQAQTTQASGNISAGLDVMLRLLQATLDAQANASQALATTSLLMQVRACVLECMGAGREGRKSYALGRELRKGMVCRSMRVGGKEERATPLGVS